MDFYSSAFGLDSTEATALNGAHTIGQMHRNGSGYTGEWKSGEVKWLYHLTKKEQLCLMYGNLADL